MRFKILHIFHCTSRTTSRPKYIEYLETHFIQFCETTEIYPTSLIIMFHLLPWPPSVHPFFFIQRINNMAINAPYSLSRDLLVFFLYIFLNLVVVEDGPNGLPSNKVLLVELTSFIPFSLRRFLSVHRNHKLGQFRQGLGRWFDKVKYSILLHQWCEIYQSYFYSSF